MASILDTSIQVVVVSDMLYASKIKMLYILLGSSSLMPTAFAEEIGILCIDQANSNSYLLTEGNRSQTAQKSAKFLMPRDLEYDPHIMVSGNWITEEFDDHQKEEFFRISATEYFKKIHGACNPRQAHPYPGFWYDLAGHQYRFVVQVNRQVCFPEHGNIKRISVP